MCVYIGPNLSNCYFQYVQFSVCQSYLNKFFFQVQRQKGYSSLKEEEHEVWQKHKRLSHLQTQK